MSVRKFLGGALLLVISWSFAVLSFVMGDAAAALPLDSVLVSGSRWATPPLVATDEAGIPRLIAIFAPLLVWGALVVASLSRRRALALGMAIPAPIALYYQAGFLLFGVVHTLQCVRGACP